MPDSDMWGEEYDNGPRKNSYQVFQEMLPADSPARVLDVGAGPFTFSKILRQVGFDVVALDLEPGRFEEQLEGSEIDARECNIESERFPVDDDSIDVVIFTEVIEHLRVDPRQILDEIHRVLRPTGTVLLSTPNLYALPTVNDFFRGNGFNDALAEWDKLRNIGHMGHIRLYRGKEIEQFFKDTGFNEININYMNWSYVPGEKRIKPLVDLVYMLVPQLRKNIVATATVSK